MITSTSIRGIMATSRISSATAWMGSLAARGLMLTLLVGSSWQIKRQVKSQKSKGKSQKCLHGERGVTLVELLIVVAIAGAMVSIVLPTFSNGLQNMRLSQASDSVAAFLNGALNRAERRQQAMEITISPREN